MKRRRFLWLMLAASGAWAQTTLWLRSSAPGMVQISGWNCGTANGGVGSTCVAGTNTTPTVLITYSPHKLDSRCGTAITCAIDISDGASNLFNGTGGGTGNCTGGGGASFPGGAYAVKYVDSTHLALYDLTGVPANGSAPHLGSGVP